MRIFYTLLYLAIFTSSSSAQTVTPLSIYTGTQPRCQDRPVTFRIANDSALTAYSWSVVPSRNLTAGSLSSRELTVTFHQPGTYTVLATATDAATRTGSMSVSISRAARAAFNASLASQGYPNELLLTNYSSNHLATIWRFSDGSTDSSVNVTKSYAGSGTREVDLIAYGPNGCNDTASYRFHIADSSGITLPNVFTPNGDGINDVYRPIARGIKTLHALVFNREQLLLHSWDRVNGMWDGRTTSGEPCTEGVYIIVVEATGFDGEEYRLRGTITLIR